MRVLLAQTWLILRNDLRLTWRGLSRHLSDYLSVALVVTVFVLMNAIAIGCFFAFRVQPPISAEALTWFFFAFVMLGASMNQAIAVLFERTDFDLLLSSPVSPAAILLARAASMTGAAALSVALFLLPLVDGAVLALSPRYIAAYLVWLLLSCAVASASVFGTLALVRTLGAWRARTWSQVLAACLGAGVYLLFQLRNLLEFSLGQKVMRAMARVVDATGFTAVARAGRGEIWPLLGVFVVTGILLAAMLRLLSRFFIGGIQDANAITPKAATGSRPYRFREGLFLATFWKDVRLIIRDPLLFARVLPSALYVLPAFLTFLRHGVVPILGPLAVVIGAQFSLSITAVAASGEEGWDLIRMSPTNELQLRYAKMAAGMAVPGVVCTVLALVLLLAGRPVIAGLTLVFSIGCAAAAAWLQVCHIQPSPRADVLRRNRGSTTFITVIIVMFLMLTGAFGLGCATNGSWLAAAVLLALATVGIVLCFTAIKVEAVSERAFST